MLPSAINISFSNVVKATDGLAGHTATLFLFHGSGGNGEDFKQWLDILNKQELSFRHIKIVYPTAPIQPYTPNGRMPSNVWFDRKEISISVPECKHSIDIICNKASELIHREVARGIPMNRIVIGGFSMGGCLAMQLAYRFKRSLAGCVAMSSFLNDESNVYKSLKSDNPDDLPELLQFHGVADNIVPLEWGKRTFRTLKDCGVKGTFVKLDATDHELVQCELNYFKDWLLKVLPENYTKPPDESRFSIVKRL
ncbi:hypothetical protein TSAR_002589 [Trichomalopsis sarcophagae]|uniref:palmitoyl-protein hydrolase n=1 Tax=Trichomalopsis sarcophagae TaxID=543379 RepID=A0A232F4V6_9HYME|nr:hypothetical protein TSAR_002589 [Trichomalopsis sarcophagae]